MKKQLLIILPLSALILSGCTTSKQVQAMIEQNNLRYDQEIGQLNTGQQTMQTQMTDARDEWTSTAEKLERICIDTQNLEEARQNLLSYCRQHSAVLSRFIESMENVQLTLPPTEQTDPVPTNSVVAPVQPAPVLSTPKPAY